MSGNGDFQSSESDLNDLIRDVRSMQEKLKSKINNLNNVVDTIEAGWKGDAARSYDHLQRQTNDYAQKLDRQLQLMEEALSASKDGFSNNEIEQIQKFKTLSAGSPISDFA
ncbi:hypothetical protein GCM10010420_24030 [Streptomyces glaucosporus]|uniref:ESAT-6-like protein n=1 Tax=Streptomyces glaucosporus TaxID=284044 RepID=A0ABP5V9T7_9ACTN